MFAESVTLHLFCRACARPVTLECELGALVAKLQRSTFCPYEDCLGIAIFPGDVAGRVLSVRAGHGADASPSKPENGTGRQLRR